MPLKGEARREYHRNYMRRQREALAVVKEQAKRVVDGVLSKAALVSRAQATVSQELLQELLEREELPLALTVQTVKALHVAERPYGRDATPGPDNDARARACELALRLHERAGTIPAAAPDVGPTSSGARVRMVQVDPDGTERWLEIG